MGLKHEQSFTFTCDLCKAEQKMTANHLPEYWQRFELRTHGVQSIKTDEYIVCGKCTGPRESLFRKKTFLIQADLAYLLKTTQQRVNEWEQGTHAMKRAYTSLMNDLEQKVLGLRRRAGTNGAKYADLMLKEFGIEIKEDKCKSSRDGKKKSGTPSLSAT